MSRGWNWKSGDWWIHCDSCGKKIKASESKERWDGFRVCKEDWEPRHSLDFIRARQEKISVDFVRKQPDVFLERAVLSDTTTVSDSITTSWETYITLVDSVTPADTFVVDTTLHLTDQIQPVEDLSALIAGRYSTEDPVTANDTGFVVIHNYIDPTYFEELYVGETRDFT